MIDIVIDFETVSTKHNAAFVALGACNLDGSHKFMSVCDVKTALAAGLVEDKETLDWWDRQNPELRNYLFSGQKTYIEVLEDFIEWCSMLSSDKLNEIRIWSRGQDFDLSILRNAIETYRSYPFDFRNHRDVRTAEHFVPHDWLANWSADCSSLEKHNPLNDAFYAAGIVRKALECMSKNSQKN